MTYIGISRGTYGTIGIIKENGEVIFQKIPWKWRKAHWDRHLDYKKFTELLKPYASTQMNEVRTQINAKALIEKPFTDKKIHWSTRLTTQRFFEAEVAILEALGIRYEIVEPIEWERDMFTGKFLKLTSEQASLAYGNELYPQLTQEKATDRDGICMAFYLKNARQFGKK